MYLELFSYFLHLFSQFRAFFYIPHISGKGFCNFRGFYIALFSFIMYNMVSYNVTVFISMITEIFDLIPAYGGQGVSEWQ